MNLTMRPRARTGSGALRSTVFARWLSASKSFG